MELIVKIISKYIEGGRRIVLPNLGAFLVKQSTGEVIFSEFLQQDDGVLRSELVKEGLKDVEAAGAINRFVFELRNTLKNGGSKSLEGIGSLSIDKLTSKIAFTPNGYPPEEVSTGIKRRRESINKDSSSANKGAKCFEEQELFPQDESTTETAQIVEESTSPAGEDSAVQDEAQPQRDNTRKAKVRPPFKTADQFSGRFCDENFDNETLIYPTGVGHRRRGGGYKSPSRRRFDLVLILAFVVLIAALGAIAYSLYTSSSGGDVNPIIEIWESAVNFFNNLF